MTGLQGLLALAPTNFAQATANLLSPLHDQVVNPDTGHHYKSESRFSIELLFYGVDGLDRYFVPDARRPRSGCIKFSENQKDKFARDVVSELEPVHFDCFKPVFDFIISKQ